MCEPIALQTPQRVLRLQLQPLVLLIIVSLTTERAFLADPRASSTQAATALATLLIVMQMQLAVRALPLLHLVLLTTSFTLTAHVYLVMPIDFSKQMVNVAATVRALRMLRPARAIPPQRRA